jgi:hypothetical protein
MPPPKLFGESSEVNVGVFIERVGWALNGIPIKLPNVRYQVIPSTAPYLTS